MNPYVPDMRDLLQSDFWQQYHSHVYGLATIASIALAVVFYLYPPSSVDLPGVPVPRVTWPPADYDLFPSSSPLRWQMPPNVPAPRKFRVELSAERDFADSVFHFQGRDHMPLAEVSRSIARFLDQGQHLFYWRVQAIYEGDRTSPWSLSSSFRLFDSSLGRIRHTRSVSLAVSQTQEDLFSCVDEHGDWQGIDIDLVRALIRSLNSREKLPQLEPEPVVRPFPWPNTKHPDQLSIWQALEERRVDLLVAAVTASRDREAEHGIRFSKTYFATRQTVLTRPKDGAPNLRDLRGRRLGAQVGTTNQDLAKHLQTLSPPYQGADSVTALLGDLESGKLDAVLLDEPFAYMRNRIRPPESRFVVRPLAAEELESNGYPGPKTEDYAIAVHATEIELLKILNRQLVLLESEGFFEVLRQQMHQPSKCS